MVGRVSVPLVLGCRYRCRDNFTVPVLLSANLDSRTGLGTNFDSQYRIWLFVTDVVSWYCFVCKLYFFLFV